jgi:hypothetical protein
LTAANSASPHCCAVSCTVPSRRRNASIWVIRNAPTISAPAILFICELLNVSSLKTVPVSLRHSNAATTSISENATRPIDWPIAMSP